MTREDPYQWFARTTAEMTSRLERIRDIGDEVRDVRGEAESPDGTVRAVVGPRGTIHTLELRHSSQRLPREELADAIVATIHQAAAEAAKNLADVLAPVMGDGEALRARITGESTLDGKSLGQAATSLREATATPRRMPR